MTLRILLLAAFAGLLFVDTAPARTWYVAADGLPAACLNMMTCPGGRTMSSDTRWNFFSTSVRVECSSYYARVRRASVAAFRETGGKYLSGLLHLSISDIAALAEVLQ